MRYSSQFVSRRLPLRKYCLVFGVFSAIFVALIVNSDVDLNTTVHSQNNVPTFILRSNQAESLSDSFVTSLAAASPQADNNVFLFRQDTGEVTVIGDNRKTRTVRLPVPSARLLGVNSNGDMYVADQSQMLTFDTTGRRLANVPIPATTTSLAPLKNRGFVIADADSEGLMTIFDVSGKMSRRIGILKSHDTRNARQNRFLNSGIVRTDPSGNIYWISTFSPNPVVQKFSVNGEFVTEFAIEGPTVELQRKFAHEFLENKKADCTGGYQMIRSATIDPTTGHLWIGMSGLYEPGVVRPESGVLYEYNSEGKKLAEYALALVTKDGTVRELLTDVKDVAVTAPYVNILTLAGQVYRFNLKEGTLAMPTESMTKRQ
jgi:hypothetical protein